MTASHRFSPDGIRGGARRALGFLLAIFPLLTIPAAAEARTAEAPPGEKTLHLPWREAGLTERQAAAHLIDRFGYGPRPGNLDAMVEMGLETWLERQLDGSFENPGLDRRLERHQSLGLSAREIAEVYPTFGSVLRQAQREGLIEPEWLEARGRERPGDTTASAERSESASRPDDRQRRKIREWAEKQGFRPTREALGELMVQKLARALYSDNQLHAVLSDFCFNHFHVSITDNQARIYVWPYERDAIRPHVLGNFGDMLEATAKHPAMLHYLDNVRSAAEDGMETTFDREKAEARMRRGAFGRFSGRGGFGRERERFGREERARPRPRAAGTANGLNENYARELMELHTLGVDGGYSQRDVEEVARAFTGWSTYPPEGLRPGMQRTTDRLRRMPDSGFVFEESFLFRADVHDAEAKTVLGHRLPPNRGIEDGLDVLEILASNPATARHLAHKMAVRFVADAPPSSLEERLAEVFLATGGNLQAMVVALAESPEFWATEHRHAKIKSPFGLTVSALRITGATVEDPRGILQQISRMGQPLYAYQAPTGYPDRADAWVSSGSLLARMNFGLQLATGRIPGVSLDLPGLDGGREPESLDHALGTYVPLLLPERDPADTVARLEPMVRDPDLARKIEQATPEGSAEPEYDDWDPTFFGGREGRPRGRGADRRPLPPTEPDTSPVAQVVGVILGSPEFQRR
ncbi:MAG: DUF1800 domain-containing protein [Holophagales bacterium]|nr:DUF1800 domain-containing protein [Holophagales bacterium]